MPGATRDFSYSLTPKDRADVSLVAAKARKILAWACDGDDRITCKGIEGEALGLVTLKMTIVGRDRWWAMQLAQDILNIVTWNLEKTVQVDLALESWALPPHTNRGYAHGRTKRYRSPRTKETAASDDS